MKLAKKKNLFVNWIRTCTQRGQILVKQTFILLLKSILSIQEKFQSIGTVERKLFNLSSQA